ncbi:MULTISPECIES: hypothetical protein [Photorhabdus]|uniref:hypothetical protein n=1 Tax=Photorhabdus TaxID=29487 RepID=UPI000DD8C907|nr:MULTISPECIES: hypothetical protein [Photorhabdus]MCT8342325.1 hypothetical protein [Photorhabdus kleinii]
MTPSDPLACAIKDVASAQKTTFATTQAIWRFLNNDRIAFSQLNEPIIQLVRKEIARSSHFLNPFLHEPSLNKILAFCTYHD